MKNTIEEYVIGLYLSLLRDFLYVSPTMDKEYRLAKCRLHSIIADRGLSFMTITLPDACKYLEKSLATGKLADDPPPYHGAKSSTDPRPTFLWGLWTLVFDDLGMLRTDPSIDAIDALRQLYLFAKKLKLPCTEDRIDDSLIEFLAIDKGLPPSHADTWDCDDPVWSHRDGHPLWGTHHVSEYQQYSLFSEDLSKEQIDSETWDKFGRFCRLISSQLGPIDLWSLRPKHGPGAVADDFKVKYELQHWPAKLARVFPCDWFGSTDLVDRSISAREFPSRVICVPKTQKGPRIIAAEQTAHQWMQGAVERWLRERILYTDIGRSIDFRNQSASQVLALEASKDGRYATVDLSAASDRISTRLVEFIFQSHHDLLDCLHACRSRMFMMPDGSTHITRKFACMGSACTFPVQTYLFTLCAVFSIMMEDNDYSMDRSRLRRLASEVRVFGDDIIMPNRAYGCLYKLLTELGLKINATKSFSTGKFRESCGMDAYDGVDVTPAYILQQYKPGDPESLISVVESSNNFYKKGCWNASAYLMNTVDPEIAKAIRVTDKDVSGPRLFSFVGEGGRALRARYNRDLHREEVYQLSLHSRTKVVQGTGNASLLQYFSEEPAPDTPYQSGQAMRPALRLQRRWEPLDV